MIGLSTSGEGTSVEEFAERFNTVIAAGAAVIHIRAREVVRAILALRETTLVHGNIYKEWDIAHGIRTFDLASMQRSDMPGDGNVDINVALGVPLAAEQDAAASPDAFSIYAFVNPHHWMQDNPMMEYYLQQASALLPATSRRIVIVGPDQPLPEYLAELATSITFAPPSHSELRQYFTDVLSGVKAEGDVIDVDDQGRERICYAAAGLPRDTFETHVSLAIVETARKSPDKPVTTEDLLRGIAVGKTEVVGRNDLLELYQPEDMANVGGMRNLKEWIRKRAMCYTDEAKEFGIDPPKGIVCVGIPGTGKSLAAKAISSELGIPLIRLDMGRVFNSYIGASEQRIRTALAMVESMAPVVLFLDEIDKGLGGIGGSGDSGTSSRVLGTFLTWLQDNKAPVFTMVTANNITGLPPELLRRGRFDEIFATGFPTAEERKEVLAIHLRRRGYSIKDFTAVSIQEVVNASKGYVPAEIEAAVKDGLISAFSDGNQFSLDYAAAALRRMVPMSVTYGEVIQRMSLWMRNNATPASSRYEDVDSTTSANVTPIAGTPRQTRVRPAKPRNPNDDGGNK